MDKLENWYEVTRGLFRYVIAAKVCYEIHVLTHDHATDIFSANSKLYLVGDWVNSGRSVFEREELFVGPLGACIEAAVKDNKENNM